MPKLSDFKATRLDGTEEDLGTYDGKVVLVVNTASECGFTPQYEGLEKLYEQYADQGLVVLGFPCNQFGGQEPGTASEIGAFCQKNYGVTFPMFDKVDVNGDDAHPLFRWLQSEQGGLLGSKIKWNFTKFLLNRQGEVVDRFGPTTKPEKLAKDIEAQL
jgi:glutathione peroxidase